MQLWLMRAKLMGLAILECSMDFIPLLMFIFCLVASTGSTTTSRSRLLAPRFKSLAISLEEFSLVAISPSRFRSGGFVIAMMNFQVAARRWFHRRAGRCSWTTRSYNETIGEKMVLETAGANSKIPAPQNSYISRSWAPRQRSVTLETRGVVDDSR